MKQWERDRHWQHIGNTYQNVSYIQTLFVFKEEQDFLWDLKEEKKKRARKSHFDCGESFTLGGVLKKQGQTAATVIGAFDTVIGESLLWSMSYKVVTELRELDESQMCKHYCGAVFSGDYSRLIWLSGLVILASYWLIGWPLLSYYENRAIYSPGLPLWILSSFKL